MRSTSMGLSWQPMAACAKAAVISCVISTTGLVASGRCMVVHIYQPVSAGLLYSFTGLFLDLFLKRPHTCISISWPLSGSVLSIMALMTSGNPAQTFSKVSALVHWLWRGTTESTFTNVCRHCIAQTAHAQRNANTDASGST